MVFWFTSFINNLGFWFTWFIKNCKFGLHHLSFAKLSLKINALFIPKASKLMATKSNGWSQLQWISRSRCSTSTPPLFKFHHMYILPFLCNNFLSWDLMLGSLFQVTRNLTSPINTGCAANSDLNQSLISHDWGWLKCWLYNSQEWTWILPCLLHAPKFLYCTPPLKRTRFLQGTRKDQS